MKQLQQLEPGLNAYKFNFDSALLVPLQKLFEASLKERLNRDGYAYLFDGLNQINIQITNEELKYHITSYGTAPLLWISNNNAHTYNIFKTFMDKLNITGDIKALVDFENKIEVYCGFFVVGKGMDRATWHKDFQDGAQGYTLITPLFELEQAHGNLMYKDASSNIKTYPYKINEAVVFGDGFEHATEPYAKTDNLRVMLSFTFGTDKIEHWDTLKKTIGEQSNYMILPCGHQKGMCDCYN
ncbi:hypothetical protein MNBD_GAMMA23-493 [hydrothermal vent metagenome]|uniref:Prolyl 4-hydroxylase alpha subunit Fe(2+) 2OG dioxygenase domain-containing protein n=1 Tax=hydrothermal vent metagenome TaxID=652676 RepID=A0A3B1A4S0_9ZZZZ